MENEELIRKLLPEAEVQKLLKAIEDFDKKSVKLILDGIGKEMSDAQKRAILRSIEQAAVVVDGQVKEWLVPTITGAYIAGANATDELLATFKVPVGNQSITLEVIRTVPEMKPHLDAVNTLLSDAYLDFGSGIRGYVKSAEHILNDALRQQIQSKIALGRLSGESIREIQKAIKNELQERGFKVLLDRGGHTWTLDRYSEMLARTHVIRANNQATLLRGAEFDVDTYEISTHGATDAACSVQEGKLYSMTGTSKTYPPLAGNEPPYHPNCGHSLIPRPDLDA